MIRGLRIKRKTRTPGIPLEDILNLQGLLTKTDVSAYASAVVSEYKTIRQVITAGLSPA